MVKALEFLTSFPPPACQEEDDLELLEKPRDAVAAQQQHDHGRLNFVQNNVPSFFAFEVRSWMLVFVLLAVCWNFFLVRTRHASRVHTFKQICMGRK